MLDAIFSTTDDGVLSLAALRDASGRTFDGSEIQVLTFGRRVTFDSRDGYLVAIAAAQAETVGFYSKRCSRSKARYPKI